MHKHVRVRRVANGEPFQEDDPNRLTTFREIAEALNMSESSVKDACKRGLAKLAKNPRVARLWLDYQEERKDTAYVLTVPKP